MSDGSDEKAPPPKPGAEPEPRRRVRARQPTLLGVAAPSLAATIASAAKEASAAAPPAKPAPAPPKPASGLGRPGVPKPGAALGRTLTGSAALERERARTEVLPSKLAPKPPRPAVAAPKIERPKPAPTVEPAKAAPPVEETEDLEASPTHVGAAPETPAEPEPGFTGPPPEGAGSGGFGGPAAGVDPADELADELPGESTQVAAAQPAPDNEVPPDLPFEATMPAAKVPEPAPVEAAAEEPARESPPPKELAVEPTVVVHPSLTNANKPETYRLDVRSGVVELAPDAEEPPKRKSGSVVLLAVLGGLAALLVVGIGITAVLLLATDEREEVAEPATAASALAPAEAIPAPAEPAAIAAAPTPEEAAPAEEGEQEESEEPEPSADEDGPAPATGPVVSRAEIDAYELDEPRLSRRARRMSAAERRRQALRLRSAGLRLYREGSYAEAEASFREGLEHLPRDAAGCEGLARAIAQQSRFPEALAWANLAVERSPRSGAAYRVLGDIWRQAGHPDEAARAYRRGIARDPRDRWLRQRLRELD